MWYKFKLTIAVLALTLFGNISISTSNMIQADQTVAIVFAR